MFLMGTGINPFVCIDDITGKVEKLNRVIYNTIHTKEANMVILKSSVQDRFNITLTDEELDRLTNYERNNLKGFIQDLRNIVEQNKK